MMRNSNWLKRLFVLILQLPAEFQVIAPALFFSCIQILSRYPYPYAHRVSKGSPVYPTYIFPLSGVIS